MMTANNHRTHRIIAQTYQIDAAKSGSLKAIITPYRKEFLRREGLYDYHEWIRDEPDGCEYAKGDRIFLAEGWAYGFIEGTQDFVMPARCFEPGMILDEIGLVFIRQENPEYKGLAGVQPASTMPLEAVQYLFEIENVRVMRLGQAIPDDFISCSLYPSNFHSLGYLGMFDVFKKAKDFWNATYPDDAWTDVEWAADQWVAILDLAPLPELEKKISPLAQEILDGLSDAEKSISGQCRDAIKKIRDM